MNKIDKRDRMPLHASTTDNFVPTISRMFPSRTTEYPRASKQVSPIRLASNCSDKVTFSYTKVGGATIRSNVQRGYARSRTSEERLGHRPASPSGMGVLWRRSGAVDCVL